MKPELNLTALTDMLRKEIKLNDDNSLFLYVKDYYFKEHLLKPSDNVGVIR